MRAVAAMENCRSEGWLLEAGEDEFRVSHSDRLRRGRPELADDPCGITPQIENPPDRNHIGINAIVNSIREPPAKLAVVAEDACMDSSVEHEGVDFRVD